MMKRADLGTTMVFSARPLASRKQIISLPEYVTGNAVTDRSLGYFVETTDIVPSTLGILSHFRQFYSIIGIPQQMDISYVDPPDAGMFCGLQTTEGVSSRCGRKVSQIETGIEAQQAVRDFGVEAANIPGYGIHLLLIYVARDQQGAGNQERGFRPLGYPLAQLLEIIQGFLIRNATQGFVKPIVPGLQIELDAAAGCQRGVCHHTQIRLLLGAICLPTYPENSIRLLSSCKLGRR
jgi:hypothetical protein